MKTKDIYQYILGALIVLVTFALCWVVFTVAMPEKNHDIGLMVIGALVGQFVGVVQYFYGSSKGSDDKTQIISQLPALEDVKKEVEKVVSDVSK